MIFNHLESSVPHVTHNYNFRVVLRAILHDIARDDLTYLRLYVNAKTKNFGFEFQDGSTLAKECSDLSNIRPSHIDKQPRSKIRTSKKFLEVQIHNSELTKRSLKK